jgi:hypothetical protein
MADIIVVVLHEDGTAAKGEQVCANVPFVKCKKTNAQGVSVLTGLTPGKHVIYINGVKQRQAAEAPGAAVYKMSIRSVNMQVTVKHANGTAAPSQNVCADNPGVGCVSTNSSGVATLTGLAPGMHQIYINGVECCSHSAPGACPCTLPGIVSAATKPAAKKAGCCCGPCEPKAAAKKPAAVKKPAAKKPAAKK